MKQFGWEVCAKSNVKASATQDGWINEHDRLHRCTCYSSIQNQNTKIHYETSSNHQTFQKTKTRFSPCCVCCSYSIIKCLFSERGETTYISCVGLCVHGFMNPLPSSFECVFFLRCFNILCYASGFYMLVFVVRCLCCARVSACVCYSLALFIAVEHV